MKLYVYFVSDDPGVQVPESVTGVGGSAVRLMKAEELLVGVSESDGAPVAITRDNVVAHERVVRSVFEHTTPLPFRFGNIVGEEQLRSYLRTHQSALQSRLLLLRDCVEMSVKVIWQTSNRGNAETEAVPVTIDSSLDHPKGGAGAAFLMAKRREILGDEMLADKATEIASWLKERLDSSICKEQISVRPRDKLVVSAAHLVARTSLQRYRSELNKARAERPELHFLISGPWPPYSFVNIDLEFETHFGVS
jgi:hypothetical protein